MQSYLEKVKMLLATMEEWTLTQVLRVENEGGADSLARMALTSPMNITFYILVKFLHKRSIENANVLPIITPGKPT